MNSIAFFLAVLALPYFALSSNHFKAIDAFEPGPYPVNYTSILQAVSLFTDLNLGVFAPNAPGRFPIFYFATGLGGLIPTSLHTELFSRLASLGVVVVGVWKLDSPVSSFNATWFNATIDFVENRLETYLHRHGYDSNLRLDIENSFIGGHSAGSHVAVAQLKEHCLNFRGMVLLSPVDGADPNGIVNISVITPGEKVNFNVPTLQIVTGLDAIPTALSPEIPCAPEQLSGRRFFDAMNGPTWWINATAYGHVDILDPIMDEVIGVVELCTTNLTIPKEPYRHMVAGQIFSFISGVIDPVQNCPYFDNLETSGILDVASENFNAANNWTRCSPMQCSSTPMQ